MTGFPFLGAGVAHVPFIAKRLGKALNRKPCQEAATSGQDWQYSQEPMSGLMFPLKLLHDLAGGSGELSK